MLSPFLSDVVRAIAGDSLGRTSAKRPQENRLLSITRSDLSNSMSQILNYEIMRQQYDQLH
jgi:hypothetical protein